MLAPFVRRIAPSCPPASAQPCPATVNSLVKVAAPLSQSCPPLSTVMSGRLAPKLAWLAMVSRERSMTTPGELASMLLAPV